MLIGVVNLQKASWIVFPTLTLEQVYGAIAFYLGHQAEIDTYLEEGDAEFEKLRQQARQANPLL